MSSPVIAVPRSQASSCRCTAASVPRVARCSSRRHRVCIECGHRGGLDDVPLARRGTLFTFTNDYLFESARSADDPRRRRPRGRRPRLPAAHRLRCRPRRHRHAARADVPPPPRRRSASTTTSGRRGPRSASDATRRVREEDSRMDFGFSEEQEMLRSAARDFLAKEVPDDLRPQDDGRRGRLHRRAVEEDGRPRLDGPHPAGAVRRRRTRLRRPGRRARGDGSRRAAGAVLLHRRPRRRGAARRRRARAEDSAAAEARRRRAAR